MIKDCNPRIKTVYFPEVKVNSQNFLLNRVLNPSVEYADILSGGETNGRNGFTAADGFVCRR